MTEREAIQMLAQQVGKIAYRCSWDLGATEAEAINQRCAEVFQAMSGGSGGRTTDGKIISADSKRHLVDFGGIRVLSEIDPDWWEAAQVQGDWGSWVTVAKAILAADAARAQNPPANSAPAGTHNDS